MPVLTTGTRLKRGDFEIVSEISRGGFGEIYLARQARLQREVAIKVLRLDVSADEDMVIRFQREALAAANLRHPSVLTVYDFDFDPDVGVWFLAMQFVPGGRTLRALVGTSLSMAETGRIVRDIGGALDAGHGLGIVHRDVKPENVLLDGDRPLLTDFGIAHLSRSDLTTAGMALGTIPYMSPEQLRGRPVPSSDQYSLAVMAYELLAGRRPFVGDNLSLLSQIADDPPPPLTGLNPRVGAAARQAIERALSKSPDDRFGSCGEFAQALLQASSEVSTEPAPTNRLGVGILETVERTPPVGTTPALRALEIDGTPARAEVVVDGALVGRLPCTVQLSAGNHTVRVSAEGYHPAEMVVTMPRGEPVQVALDPVTYALEIAGEPIGATVRLDGTEIGILPCRVDQVTPGTHVVTVALDGFNSVEQTVIVPPQDAVTLRLERQGVRESARAASGHRPRFRVVMPLATAALAAALILLFRFVIAPPPPPPSIASEETKTTERPTPSSRPDETLPLRTGLVRLFSDPAADAFVDGRPAGRTPLQLTLPPGSYDVALRADTYQEWTGHVDVETDGEQPIDVTLDPLPASALLIPVTDPAKASRMGRTIYKDGEGFNRLATATERFLRSDGVSTVVYLLNKAYGVRDVTYTAVARWYVAPGSAGDQPYRESRGEQTVPRTSQYWDPVSCIAGYALDLQGSGAPLRFEFTVDGVVAVEFKYQVEGGDPTGYSPAKCQPSSSPPQLSS